MTTIGNLAILTDSVFRQKTNNFIPISKSNSINERIFDLKKVFADYKTNCNNQSIVKVHILEPQSIFRVFKIDSNDVWNYGNLISKIEKIYPTVDFANYNFESVILSSKVFVWVYPTYYLTLCKELSTEKVIFIPTCPFPFMANAEETQYVKAKLSDSEVYYRIKYDSENMFENVSLELNPNESITITELKTLLTNSTGHLNSESKMEKERKNFKLGKLYSFLKPTFAIVTTLLLIIALLNLTLTKSYSNRLNKQHKVIALKKDIQKLKNQMKKLHVKIENSLHNNKESSAYILNKALQCKSDAMAFTNVEIIKQNNSYNLFLKGKGETVKQLNKFVANLQQLKFIQHTLKQSINHNNKIIFSTELTYEK